METLLKKRIKSFFKKNNLTSLIERLQLVGPVYLFGGFLRDLCLDKKPLDLDLVVDGEHYKLMDYLEAYNPDVNKHGGFRFCDNDIMFDVWTLQETKLPYTEKYPSDLLTLPHFKCNCILYRWDLDLIVAPYGYFREIENRQLELNPNAIYDFDVNAIARMDKLRSKGFYPSVDLWAVYDKQRMLHEDIMI